MSRVTPADLRMHTSTTCQQMFAMRNLVASREKLRMRTKEASRRIGRAAERVDLVVVEGGVVVQKARKAKANRANLVELRRAVLTAMRKEVVRLPMSSTTISMRIIRWMIWAEILKATMSPTMS
jgi:ADP-dependent phosphofructokinase/glucokinase